MGLSAGVFNLCANLAGIAARRWWSVSLSVSTGSFAWALAYIGIVALARRLLVRVHRRRRTPRRVPGVSEHRALKVGLIGAGIQHFLESIDARR